MTDTPALCHVRVYEAADEPDDHEVLWFADCSVHGVVAEYEPDRADAQSMADRHMFGDGGRP